MTTGYTAPVVQCELNDNDIEEDNDNDKKENIIDIAGNRRNHG